MNTLLLTTVKVSIQTFENLPDLSLVMCNFQGDFLQPYHYLAPSKFWNTEIVQNILKKVLLTLMTYLGLVYYFHFVSVDDLPQGDGLKVEKCINLKETS